MSNPFDQLNLRPQERRILVIVALIIFVVLNFLLVTPLFGQLGQAENELEKSRKTLAKYEAQIEKAPNFERIEERLKKEGSEVLTGELQLSDIVNARAIANDVHVSRSNPILRTQIGRTNQFFEDQGLTIDFTSGGKELVDFLVDMASANSMVHVHDMTLRTVQNGTRLGGNIVFVASYLKKNAPSAKVLESGAAPRPATKTNSAPVAAVAKPKTNPPPAVHPPKTNVGAMLSKPKTNAPPNRTTGAAPPRGTNVPRTISTNTVKPPKK
jgi:Tfp pilus assembly protein PilO